MTPQTCHSGQFDDSAATASNSWQLRLQAGTQSDGAERSHSGRLECLQRGSRSYIGLFRFWWQTPNCYEGEKGNSKNVEAQRPCSVYSIAQGTSMSFFSRGGRPLANTSRRADRGLWDEVGRVPDPPGGVVGGGVWTQVVDQAKCNLK